MTYSWTDPCGLCSLVTRQNFCFLKPLSTMTVTGSHVNPGTVYVKSWWPLRPNCHLDDVYLPLLSADISSASDWLSSMNNHFWRRTGRRRRGTNQWLHPLAPYLSFTLLHRAGFMRLISDNLAVTRHCTQPLLIFNEGSGPSTAAFWAFKGRVFQWHFYAATSQAFPKIVSDEKAFTVLHFHSFCCVLTPKSGQEMNTFHPFRKQQALLQLNHPNMISFFYIFFLNLWDVSDKCLVNS